MKNWTEKMIMTVPKDGNKHELVNGEFTMVPAGFEHEVIGANVIFILKKFVSEHKSGVICGPDLGCWMKSENLRCPDVSFISKERLQKTDRLPTGFFKGSPDLAVEILSPSDTVEGIHEKIVEYFENDTKLAWVLNPEEQTVTVYHSPYPHKLLTNEDILEGEGVLEGFSTPVAALFEKSF
ncbi:MAG: Uma2 family endonuclease [Candidatus Brocadiaceae bacterium]|nr:Uma2 family endonuclease [Candidatus Brocadiaceae bacterium]